MAYDQCISFQTELFDYSSELPESYNAGNQFYGKDVAQYLSERLAAAGLAANYLDEDWGWLVLGEAAPSITFEIAVYNINDHSSGGQPGAPVWGLWVRAFQHGKLWRVLPRKVQIPLPEMLLTALRDAIASIGATPAAWEDGPA